jgi:MinD superfamily P-loop ATPase
MSENRTYDLNTHNTKRIGEFCAENGVEVAGRISFDTIVTEAMVSGKPVLGFSPERTISKEIEEAWRKISTTL